MPAQDGSDGANPRMTLVRDHHPRNRNWPVSTFEGVRADLTVLRPMRFSGRGAGVTAGVRPTRSLPTVPGFSGIVTARLGKTAREGGKRMARLGHAEEQWRHVTW